MTGPLDVRVRDRIVAETRGNPLALLELPRGRTPAELAGGFGLDGEPALAGTHRGALPERLETLPEATRLLLLVAAAEPVGDPLLLWRRGGRAGDRRRRGGAGGGRRPDRARCARALPPPARALGGVRRAPRRRTAGASTGRSPTPPTPRPDRRAWHRAQATAGLDEDVAAELERSAGRAGRAAACPRPRPSTSAPPS